MKATKGIYPFQSEVSKYLKIFQAEMDLFYGFSISWSTSDPTEQIGILEPRLKPAEIEFLKIIRRERDNPDIRAAIQRVISAIDTYERKSVDKERLRTGEEVPFTHEPKVQEDRENVLGKLRNKVAQRFVKELNKLPYTGRTKAKNAMVKGKKTGPKLLSYPLIARMCWCMEKTGHNEHRIVDTPSANRLAKEYGRKGLRDGARLKGMSDRFTKEDGDAFLKGGPQSRTSYGRRIWASVKEELVGLGHHDAASKADEVLGDL